GQGWEQTYGFESNNVGKSVQQTSDGGYIITGSTSNPGVYGDIYLIKTDGNGNELWSQTFEGGYCEGKSVQQTNDGGYIICGTTTVESNSFCWLIKTDGSGNELWSQTFVGIDGSNGESIQQTNDGGYIITGYTYSPGNFYDLYLIKTDESGNELWSQIFGGTGGDVGHSVQQTTDGGYIITGSTSSFGNGSSDVYLIKTDGNGNEIWTMTYGGTNNESGYSVQQTNDGGYIISGSTISLGNQGYHSDILLIKINVSGNEQWSQTFGGEDDDVGFSLQQTTDGGYIICGDTESFGNGGSDVYLIKTDSQGDSLWTKTIGGPSSDNGYCVQQTSDGGYIITGSTTFSFGNGNEVYLIKTDEYGYILPYESTLSGCDSVLSLDGETFFYENGNYIDTLLNIYGNDSIVNQNVEIYSSPEFVQINGNVIVINSSLEFYQVTENPENLFEWYITGGSVYENQNNIIQVLWGNEGIGYVEVTETDSNGCSTTSILEVTISNEPTNIYEYNKTRKLIKTINLLGQEIKPHKNQSYIEIYDDGTRKRKIIIEK
ncbi:hypothetical protein OA183_00560, partial [Flavobacteriales bacterium]|nr:hypothetical protein [Flavobacteriales bacterium]